MSSRTEPAVAILVPTHNSARVVSAFLSALPPSALYEIIAVDNNSTDSTRTLIGSYEHVRTIALSSNVGFGRAVNIGASEARAPLLLVLNPDAPVVQFDPSAIAVLATSGEQIGLRACRMSTQTDTTFFDIRDELGWIGAFADHFVGTYLTPLKRNHLRQDRLKGRRPWVSGAAFLVSRTEFLALGGFDEGIFMYGEDVDLARRYRAKGLPIGVVEGVAVKHATGTSSEVAVTSRIVWNALSLVHRTGKYNGIRRARIAATAYVLGLHAVEALGCTLSRTPRIGPRAAEQAVRAAQVRKELRSFALDSKSSWYPYARGAFCGRRANRADDPDPESPH